MGYTSMIGQEKFGYREHKEYQ